MVARLRRMVGLVMIGLLVLGVLTALVDKNVSTKVSAITQLEIATQWGRYAELLAYDDTEETFYLKSAATPGA